MSEEYRSSLMFLLEIVFCFLGNRTNYWFSAVDLLLVEEACLKKWFTGGGILCSHVNLFLHLFHDFLYYKCKYSCISNGLYKIKTDCTELDIPLLFQLP